MNYLKELLNQVLNVVKYKGCNIFEVDDGYLIFNQIYPTLDDAMDAIDRSAEYLKQSIK